MSADRSHTTIGGQVSESCFHEIPDRQWQLLHGPSKFYQSLFGFVPCNAYFQLLSEKNVPLAAIVLFHLYQPYCYIAYALHKYFPTQIVHSYLYSIHTDT